MSSEKISVVHIDDDLVVVNKPASIPVSIGNGGNKKECYHVCEIVEVGRKQTKLTKLLEVLGQGPLIK